MSTFLTTLSNRVFGRERGELKIVFALVVATLAAVLLYPLACVLFQSMLDGDGNVTFTNYTSLLVEPRFWKALGNSFAVSGLSAAIAAVLAFGCAYGLHFTRIHPWAKKTFQIVVLLPLFLPSITYGFAVIYSFGRLGLVSQIFGVLPFSIYGFWGLLIADVIYTLPPAFLILSNAFHYIDRNTITVSRLMGDSPLRTFYISALRPVVGAICSAFILSFFLSFTDFGIPVSIAGQYDVIATELYTTMMGAVPDFGRGAVIAMAMLVPSIASVMLLKFTERFNFRYNRINYRAPMRNPLRDALFAGYYVVISAVLLSVFAVMFVVPFVEQWPYKPVFTLSGISARAYFPLPRLCGSHHAPCGSARFRSPAQLPGRASHQGQRPVLRPAALLSASGHGAFHRHRTFRAPSPFPHGRGLRSPRPPERPPR